MNGWLVACAFALAGCSFAIHSPSRPDVLPPEGIRCEDSYGTPIADTLGGLALGVIGGGVLLVAGAEGNGQGLGVAPYLVGGGTILELIAAAHGYSAVSSCRDLKAHYGETLSDEPARNAIQHDLVVYETKPKFVWSSSTSSTYRLVLWRVTSNESQNRTVVYDQTNVTASEWSPPDDLDFETRYELYVYAHDTAKLVSSWGFVLGFEEPKVQRELGHEGAKLEALSPTITITPLSYANVYFDFEIADTATFDNVVDQALIAQQGNVHDDAGPDGKLNTADDVRYVEWTVKRVLKPATTYFWRVRSLYFRAGDIVDGQPDRGKAIGRSEIRGTFTIAPQPTAESLANITEVVHDDVDMLYPTIDQRLGVAYVAKRPDGSSELRRAGAAAEGSAAHYDASRDELTKSDKGSSDVGPRWAPDGDGVFFASNRSHGTFNLWYQRRDEHGKQLTFHHVDAMGPTVSSAANVVAYQVRDTENATGWSIWTVDRDGRSATFLGAGSEPAFSPDGAKIAFSMKDEKVCGRMRRRHCNQIWVMDSNGQHRTPITSEDDNHFPAWDPSGTRLAFVSDRSGNNDIWITDLDGSNTAQLTNHLGDDTTPVFTPDGRYLLFASNRTGDQAHHIWRGELPTR